MLRSLVGSEMCIRDRRNSASRATMFGVHAQVSCVRVCVCACVRWRECVGARVYTHGVCVSSGWWWWSGVSECSTGSRVCSCACVGACACAYFGARVHVWTCGYVGAHGVSVTACVLMHVLHVTSSPLVFCVNLLNEGAATENTNYHNRCVKNNVKETAGTTPEWSATNCDVNILIFIGLCFHL